MRRSRRLASKPFLLFVLFLCLVALVGKVGAQGPDDKEDKPSRTNNPGPPPKTTDNPRPTTTAPQSTDEDKPRTTQKPTETDQPNDEDLPPLTTTDPSTTTTNGNLPSITSDSPFSLPPLFKIPTPQVPPAAGAPYLEVSSLPEGTIFIAVGAALGLFGLIVFLWRVLVAWSINRSVRRAATRPEQSDSTPALLNKRKSGVYPQLAPGSSMSMEKMGGSGARLSGLPPRNHTPNSSLFFSPTAGAGMHTSGNRGSGYLPAGYYAAGAASGPGQSIGLSPLGPQTQGYTRTRSASGITPPGSPSLAPTSRGGGHEQGYPSTSSVNLSVAPQGRAPSAYLEDLFENHNPPGR
ncbi:conserved hypothetical protein [Histoplasma capsulatum G186AR]|uniref:Uncharacterized protein n=2 Tax=Ajellomyces capsulatus TaxID=5037 RepID=C0NWT1_AJECG|nr:uncharacterized protein HCBG_07611 [Histoplasma capsulatum G186AR]EEH04386.1 conserved hypothetical protein [Histoplasma capsulatum G186AR]KAG5291346.1 hypothetical protein I7I52_08643 [Histoplasma capsulatum]QSS68649.1 hypothetical protein I7I50_08127 [Histoplasma capsulatum G186AR]